jgi:3-hydroxyisobutyrate dehydrogenase-like beta-hydroxyacid dehydrogenase
MPFTSHNIALLYPGEMGLALARQLIAAGHVVATCLAGRSAATIARARSCSLHERPGLDELVRDSSLLISVVTPDAAQAVADDVASIARWARPGAIYLDLNSISPDRKSRIARQIESSGLDFVDGAINGLAANLTSTATLFLSGSHAHDIAHIVGATPRTQILSANPGDASAMKMLLSGFSKGICALYLELAELARRRHLTPQLRDAITRIYPNVESLAQRMLPTYADHAPRRAVEMHELLDTAIAAGLDPVVLRAIAQLHDTLARSSRDTNTSDPSHQLSIVH